MKLSTLFVATIITIFPGQSIGAETYSSADKQKAVDAAQQLGDIYFACLNAETTSMIDKPISASDFKLYLDGVCLKERLDYRVPFVDGLAMNNEKLSMEDAFSQFDKIIELIIAQQVSSLLKARSTK
jgi:hypothetical protein